MATELIVAGRRGRRHLPLFWVGLVFCLAVLPLSWVSAQSPTRSPSGLTAPPREVTSKLRTAVDRGFHYLLTQRRPSGDFDAEYPVAADALVGLAFLAGGYTERIGPKNYTAAVRSCTDALLRRQLPCGYFSDRQSRMYGHGFATLYFAQLYGMSHRPKVIQAALRRAIRVIEISQGADGGWDYEPHAECGGSVTGASDTSITVCQAMALRAARNLGLAVSPTVIAQARRYIQQAQNGDGGFRYRQQQGAYVMDQSSFPRSAAGVCILYSLGGYNTDAIRRGFSYLRGRYRKPNLYPYYAQYYCSQAMFQSGGKDWREYFTFMRDRLLALQNIEGGWPPRARENKVQATAMVLIVLQLPYRLLPILER
ncbi:MAG: terpene cyclase/mutase family protein [Planctomycetes bacterium]|nr:terpene cyclase/mutase family protein [Planctomycetota bacterium]